MPDPVIVWRKELKEAGWIEESSTTYRSPAGNIYRGPFRAWQVMKEQKSQRGWMGSRGQFELKPRHTPSGMEKQYTGIVLNKGVDADGAFVTLQVINQYGKHEMGFEVEEKDLDMYHPGQIATMTCFFEDKNVKS